MKTWYEIMVEIAEDDPANTFRIIPADPDKGHYTLSVVVIFTDGTEGLIFQTSGGQWTFTG